MASVHGVMVDDVFEPRKTCTQSLGGCSAQLAELKTLLLALENADPEFPTIARV